MKQAKHFEPDQVIADEMRFKAKLAIGENAYASLRMVNATRKYWDLFGAAAGGAGVAKSTAVATAFFAPKGILGLIGLGTAATPLGWAVAAAVLSGGAWYLIMSQLSRSAGARVDVIPKFINTPLDVLGLTLFGLAAPLALKIASSDGEVSDLERDCIRKYFGREWGYDDSFVRSGIAICEESMSQISVDQVASELAEYVRVNPDCNYESMAGDLTEFLREVMESDGLIDDRELTAIRSVETVFQVYGRTALSKALDKVTDAVRKPFAKGEASATSTTGGA